jgi:hypothetical protein
MELVTILTYVSICLSVAINVLQAFKQVNTSYKLKTRTQDLNAIIEDTLIRDSVMASTIEAESIFDDPKQKKCYASMCTMRDLDDYNIDTGKISNEIEKMISYSKLVNNKKETNENGKSITREPAETSTYSRDDARTIPTENERTFGQDNGTGDSECERSSESQGTDKTGKLNIY